jgi:hypothetical protein
MVKAADQLALSHGLFHVRVGFKVGAFPEVRAFRRDAVAAKKHADNFSDGLIGYVHVIL